MTWRFEPARKGAIFRATSPAYTTGQAIIPEAASGMPPLTFPMATLIFFKFVFAAITVIILAGSVLGRMNFTAWMIFWRLSEHQHIYQDGL